MSNSDPSNKLNVNTSINTESTTSESHESVPKFRAVQLDRVPQIKFGGPPDMQLRKSSIFRNDKKVFANNENEVLTSETCPWNVKEVSPLPQDYNLARSSRFIENTGLPTICTRIVKALRKLGLKKVDYNSDDAIVNCETPYFVKMNICLHRGKRRSSNGTIVEIRRTSGGCIEFMADCRSILNAAEGNDRCQSKVGPAKSIEDMECIKNSDKGLENDSKHAKDALDCSERYLKDARTDSKVLGLKSLNSLLDKKNCSCATLKLVYCSVFIGELNPLINQEVLSYLERKFDSDIDNEYKKKLHSLALQVIYNSFNACRTICQEGIAKGLKEIPWLTDSLTPVLVQDLMDVESSPYDAFYALKCLNMIVPLSEDVKNKALDAGLLSASREAHRVGKLYCEKMTIESEFMLKELGYPVNNKVMLSMEDLNSTGKARF